MIAAGLVAAGYYKLKDITPDRWTELEKEEREDPVRIAEIKKMNEILELYEKYNQSKQVKEKQMNNPHHPEAAEDEIFVGNTHKEVYAPAQHFKTIRLGKQAYDTGGNALPWDMYRPIFIDKSEFAAYQELMSGPWDVSSTGYIESLLL